MSPAIAAAVLWHVAGGVVVAALGVLALRRHAKVRASPQSRFLLLFMGAICAMTGVGLTLYVLAGGSMGHARTAFLTHVAAGFVAVGMALWRMLSRRQTQTERSVRSGKNAVTLLLMLVSTAAFGGYVYVADSYYLNLTATNARQAGNPLFPAGPRVEPGEDWSQTPTADHCGQAGCHPDAFHDWLGGPHATAAQSYPYFRQIQRTVEAGRTPADLASIQRWCKGCHAPSALLETVSGSDAAVQSVSKRANPGVDCLSCHAIRSVPEPTGNGRAHYALPAEYPFGSQRSGAGAWMHGLLLRLRPAPHTAGLTAVTNASGTDRSQACVSCHRLSITAAQNHYKFLRYDDTWSEWQQSAYSGESLHTAVKPAARKDCVSCHPPHQGNTESDRMEKLRRSLRLEIFALRREAGSAGTERLDAPLTGRTITVRPGSPITLDVLLENTGIGHTFPSGVPDIRESWLEVTVTDVLGKVLLDSGIGTEGAHRYGLVALDRKGDSPHVGSKADIVSPVIQRSVSPEAGDVARYRFTPQAGDGDFTVKARLMHLATSQRDSSGGAGHLPLPQVVAEHSVSLRLEHSGTRLSASSPPVSARGDDAQAAPRFYAYGMALLAQKDGARARRALQQASRLVPVNAEYLTGLGRAYIAEGDLLSARRSLEEALRKEPGSPRPQAWLGKTFRLMGQFEAALRLLEPLAQRYPRDRALWQDIGLCYMRIGRNEEAARAFAQLLSVDPDDAGAHYNLMQCYLRQRKLSLARQEETLFRTLQEDEPLRGLTERYFEQRPKDRMETLQVHEHLLTRVPGSSPRWEPRP